ncbi:MAG: O-antigen ligase family protein [Candidatus Omnitrophica bacterium]|nr:O-antigen ligase family protein [Candidatus Omnitrophota bacterium]
MKRNFYNSIFFYGLVAIVVFSALFRGAVRLWEIMAVAFVVNVLFFVWLWKINNKRTSGANDAKERSSQKTKLTAFNIVLWLFVIIASLSCYYSVYRYASIIAMIRLFSLVGVFYIILNNGTRYVALRLVTCMIIVGAGLSLLGLGQHFGYLKHVWNITSQNLSVTFENANHFAGYLELILFLTVGVLIGINRDNVNSLFHILILRIALLAALISMSIALFYTQSIAALIGVLGTSLVMILVLAYKGVVSKRAIALGIIVILICAAGICWEYDFIIKKLDITEEKIVTVIFEERLELWDTVLNLIKDAPYSRYFGTGIGTLKWAYPAYRSKKLAMAWQRIMYADNEYLHVMAEMGIVALPVMILMLFIVICTGIRGRGLKTNTMRNNRVGLKVHFILADGIMLGCSLGLLSVSIHGLFDASFRMTATMLLMSIFAAIIMRMKVDSHDQQV